MRPDVPQTAPLAAFNIWLTIESPDLQFVTVTQCHSLPYLYTFAMVFHSHLKHHDDRKLYICEPSRYIDII